MQGTAVAFVAQVRLLGAPTQSLLRWGGWATSSMLKVYAYLPSS